MVAVVLSWFSARCLTRRRARCGFVSRPAGCVTVTVLPWKVSGQAFPSPRIPGHEIAGIIDAVGTGVVGWSVGQRVGVGWFGGHCGRCEPCRRGWLIDCRNLRIPGISYDGGY